MLNTESRKRVAKARANATKNLADKGWKFDGLWWISPHTGFRYSLRDALGVEELRAWSEGDSAFLNDKDHSMWVKKEIEDNALISMEEMGRKSSERQAMRKRAVDGCYGRSVI